MRQGDDRAFEELFSRYRSRITAYVLGMVRDHARAEDLTQEVFLSALRRLRDTERPIAFKPWIYEIAKNACIDEFRRTRRATEVSLIDDDDSSSDDGNLLSRSLTPDAAMENKERLEALCGAFRGLSENHHRILVMRELEGLSYSEIATRLGMSRPMVESTLFRARRRLGEEYEDLSTGRRCQQVCEVVDRTQVTSIRVLGVRARRQVALHLSHCNDCRRYARLAGADESLFRAPSFADKVAALLPFGWLGRHLVGPGRRAPGQAFVARHMPAASQYAGPLGSDAILGRVAAAILVIAAAGGSYAGVTSGASKPAAHNAAAVIQHSAVRGSSAGHASGSNVSAATLAGTAALLKQSAQGARQSGKRGVSATRHGGAPAAPGTHAGASAPSAGGSFASSPSGTGSSSGARASHHGIVSSNPVTNVVSSSPVTKVIGKVLSPVLPHLPLKTSGGNTGVHLPSLPNLPKPAAPQAPVPNPAPVLKGVSGTVNQVTGGASKVLNGLTSGGH